MAQQNLNSPATSAMGPNSGDSPERGDKWKDALDKIQANFTELYASVAAIVTPVGKRALVAGGAAGDITVTGIKVGDQLIAVLRIIGAGTAVTDLTDLTAEFTISATNKINNAAGTDSTGDKLLVLYNKLTA